MADDNNAYLGIFLEEAREHIQALNERLMEMEQSAQDPNLVSEIFRSAHTLKGMAATMGFEQMTHLTHEMENALDRVRKGELQLDAAVMDVLFQCVDKLESQVDAIVQTGSDGAVPVDSLLKALVAIVAGTPVAANVAQGGAGPAGSDGHAGPGGQGGPSSLLQQGSKLLEYTEAMVEEAASSGQTVYAIVVTLEPACVMRGVRAFMVVRAFEELGVIVKSEPSANELEDGKFEGSFELLMVSENSAQVIEQTGLSVSEVASVQVQDVRDLVNSLATAASLDPTGAAGIGSPAGSSAGSSAGSAAGEVAATAGVASVPSAATTGSSGTAGTSGAANAGGDGKPSRVANKSIRVDVERLDALMNLFSEFVIDKTRLELIARRSKDPTLSETVQHLARVGTDLQDLVMKMRMVGLDTVFNRFPRMVRDLAKTLNKKVDFVVTGAETELDRTIVDEISDPLVHIFRNSLDHGLENPADRTAAGKSDTGRLHVAAYQAGNHVFIEIEDDGRGIQRARVLQKAIERKLVDPGQAQQMTDEQVFNLLFQSGFSTAEAVTDISGRGVGLDAAKSKIVGLGGDLFVESTEGKGSKFTIQLPLTLSILDAMLVQVGAETYAIPLNSILQIDRRSRITTKAVHGQQLMDFQGRLIPMMELRTRFNVPGDTAAPDKEYIVVIHKGDRQLAVVIDAVLGQQEIVLKSLGNYLAGSAPGVSGATILGDGQVSLILDVNALIR